MENSEASDRPSEIAPQLEALIGQAHTSEDYIRFRVEMLDAVNATYQKLAGIERHTDESPKDRSRAPAMVLDELPLNPALLCELCRHISVSLRGRWGSRVVGGSSIEALADEPDVLEELVRSSTCTPDEDFLNSLSLRLEIPADALLFLGRLLAAPFVTDAVHRYRDAARGPTLQSSGPCPYCGSPPGLAMLKRPDGRRILSCSLCGQCWDFPRLTCPFCESEGTIDMLTIDVGEHRWIETCQSCNRYLKTIDERKLPEGEEIIPVVEATATLYLDLIAEQEGCRSGEPYVAIR